MRNRDEFICGFLDRLQNAMDRKGMSRTETSVAINGPRKKHYISNLFRQKNIPGADYLASLCQVLDVSPSYLLGLSGATTLRRFDGEVYHEASRIIDQAVELAQFRIVNDDMPPTIDALVSWWRSNGKRLEGLDRISSYIDVYQVPDPIERRLRPLRLGANSVAGQSLCSTDPRELMMFLNRIPRSVVDEAAKWHLECDERSSNALTSETLLAPLPTGTTVRMEYDRLLLPVDAPNGERLILSYARLFGTPQVVVQDIP